MDSNPKSNMEANLNNHLNNQGCHSPMSVKQEMPESPSVSPPSCQDRLTGSPNFQDRLTESPTYQDRLTGSPACQERVKESSKLQFSIAHIMGFQDTQDSQDRKEQV